MKLVDISAKTPKDFIDDQIKKEDIKELDNLKPIDHSALAKPHTPIYKIHRYFARRPYSVFNELVKHYSNPGETILDPFCGGGVTVIESLRSRRKTIGVDLSPVAAFITEMEAAEVDINKIDEIFNKIKNNVRETIQKYYLTECPNCKRKTAFHWMKWSHVYECPNCKKSVTIRDLDKRGPGRFICNKCKKPFKPIEARKLNELPFELEVRCNCKLKGFKITKKPDRMDLKIIKKIKQDFDKIILENNFWYPKDRFIDGDLEKDHSLCDILSGINA